tara:strand:+ start:760 stop:1479 length:720 start_codon:yes stop_codon:yes gene_type:complete
MDDDSKTYYFSATWAVLFLFLTLNLVPIPFAYLISFLGEWIYQNPVTVDMNFLGEVKMYPVADNLNSIISMSAIMLFILWRMRSRNIPFDKLGSLVLYKKDLLLGSLFLAIFVGLEEIYMRALGLEIPKGFIVFMLSEPLFLSFISVIIIAPIAEEFLFRGFLYSQLQRTQLGSWGSVTAISFLWTIIHFQYEPLILIVLFLFGMFLGYVRIAYNSLSLPIALHAINNLFAFIIIYFFG